MMATADAAERAAQAKKQAQPGSSLPDWARPSVWTNVQIPNPTVPVSRTAVAPAASTPVVPGMDRWISITPDAYAATIAARSQTDAATAWEKLVGAAGIEALGVPTNWWPGIGIANYDEMIQGFVNLEGSDRRFAGMFPDALRPESWAAPSVTVGFDDPANGPGVDDQLWVRYDPARAAQQYMLMGASKRSKFSQLMADAGLLDEEWGGISEFDPTTAAAFSQALSLANYYGKPVEEVLKSQAALFQKLKDRRGGGGGGGGGGPQVKLEVPDYETLTQNAKDSLRQNLGRDPQDWEMTLVADEMQRQYGRWADATKARMIGGNGTYEIPDPGTLTQAYVERTYSDEISRLEDIGDTRQNNQLLIAAATKGTDMLGGVSG
jgi:hypothetical protein